MTSGEGARNLGLDEVGIELQGVDPYTRSSPASRAIASAIVRSSIGLAAVGSARITLLDNEIVGNGSSLVGFWRAQMPWHLSRLLQELPRLICVQQLLADENLATRSGVRYIGQSFAMSLILSKPCRV